MTMDLEPLEEDIPAAELRVFEQITQDYTLISKIGEGTFSTVYKAEDKYQFLHDNTWLLSRGGDPKASYYVAIKRIYATSSPARTMNEIEILRSLEHSNHVLPIVTAFRAEDQVFIVLPYFRHPDFRTYYRKLPLHDVRYYMRSLFRALCDVHEQGVIHRDVKPTNFLYDVQGRNGELVDFGLAERQRVDNLICPCATPTQSSYTTMVNPTHARLAGVYLKEDQRPGKRANRAGTRGFRAPEVLLKCENQTTAVDIWSAGVILLSFLTGRFPFFYSFDDVDALVELASIYGKAAMRKSAAQHGCSFETNVPSLHDRPISYTRLIHWSTDSTRKSDDSPISAEQAVAIEFLEHCMTLDSRARWTASEALQHPFLRDIEVDESIDALNSVENQTLVLQPAATLDEKTPVKDTTHDDATDPDPAQDTSNRATAARPKEMVFLATDEKVDEQLHDRMRQEAIMNVNLHRIRRELSQRGDATPRANEPRTPVQQILQSPAGGLTRLSPAKDIST